MRRNESSGVREERASAVGGDVRDVPSSSRVKRVPVDYRYDALNPTFLKWMAKIGAYAAEKYGSWEQYRDGRLEGEKSPVNHIHEHLRAYVMGEPHDHFDGDVRWHLVAVAYNAMMEFFYCTKWGHVPHPLTVSEREE
jgi:hypothetical protein